MEFKKDFFDDEVREGFYVPGIMKRCWAASIEVLGEIDRVCKKHNIAYYLDCGNLLGAKRNGGFIPWDDDLDISMNREDFNAFQAVIDQELPPELDFNSVEKNREFDNIMAAVGLCQLSLERDRLRKYHDFPFPVVVDICINDRVAKDVEAESRREAKLSILTHLWKKINDRELSGKNFEKAMQLVESHLKVHFNRQEALAPQVTRLLNRICKEFEGEKGRQDLYAWIPEGLKGSHIHFPQEEMFPLTTIQFEGFSFPAPKNVDCALRIEFGDYEKPSKAGGNHGYPYFRKHEQDVIELAGGEDKWSFHYPFQKKDLEHEKKDNIRDMALAIFRALNVQEEAMKSRVEEYSFLQEALANTQDTALTLGNTIEQCLGENTKTVPLLSQYCEIIFRAYEKAGQGIPPREELHSLGEKRLECEKAILQEWKKTMLILLDRAKHFPSIEGFYKKMREREDWEVLLMPIPYFYRRGDGSFMEEEIDREDFPKEYSYVEYKSYAFDSIMPDCIVMNSPYDSFNIVQSIDPFFYSNNMKKYTKNLIYIPWFVTDEIQWGTEEDGKAIINMDYYVCQPGLAHADYSFVQSENTRKTYIEKLTEFTGEEYRAVWEKKIVASGSCLQGREEELVKHILSRIES